MKKFSSIGLNAFPENCVQHAPPVPDFHLSPPYAIHVGNSANVVMIVVGGGLSQIDLIFRFKKSCSAMGICADLIIMVAVITAPILIQNSFRKKKPVNVEEVKPHQA